MKKRLWMTLSALATPAACLVCGVLGTIGAFRVVAQATDLAHRKALEEALVAAATTFADRLDADGGIDARPVPARAAEALTGLHAGPDTGLAVRFGGQLVTQNAGQARLVELDRRAVPGHPGLELAALGPSTYYVDALPVVVGAVGTTTTVLVGIGTGVWSLQGRRRKAVERDLARTYRASRHDALTGLANRPHLMEWLEGELRHGAGSDRSLGLIFIDVDRFKTVNDTMGHAIGDDLLKEVARRLSGSVRAGDLVARLAGDEFVIAFPGVADADRLAELAERCQSAFDAPVELRTGPFYASISMGLAIGDAATASSHALLEQADAAMYVAKSTPGVRFAFFDEQLRAEADSRQVLGDALRAGLDDGELLLHYQPVVAVGSDEVVAVEAFVRWERPGHGTLLPGAFLPVAEDTGLIGAVGRMVVREACRQAAAWNRRPGLAALPVSVNVSERQLLAPDFATVVRRAIADSAISPALLQIELNEVVAADRRVRSSGVLDELRALGVTLIIDDFALRNGSLGMLKELPISGVKIHGSAVCDVADDESDQAVIEAVVNLAAVRRTMVVAENVETPEQLAMLRQLGVRNVQGHLLLAPAPAAELGALARGRQLTLRHGTGPVVGAGTALRSA